MRKSRASNAAATVTSRGRHDRGSAAFESRAPHRRGAAAGRATAPRRRYWAHCSVTETAHIEIGPQHLMAEFDVLHHLRRHWPWWWSSDSGRRPRRDVVPSSRRSHPRAASGHSVPGRGQRRERVGVDRSRNSAGVRALDVDLAQRRDIADADRARTACTSRLTVFEPVRLAGPGELLRPQPEAALDEDAPCSAAQSCVGVQPRRAELLAAVVAGQRADRDRRVGRAEGGGAGLARSSARSARAMSARPLTLEVLPWSVAMPSVV